MAEGGLQFTDKTIEEIEQFQYDYLTPEAAPVDRLTQLADAIDQEIKTYGKCHLRMRYLANEVEESYRRIPAVRAHLELARVESEVDRWLMIAKQRGFEVVEITALNILIDSISTEGVVVLRRKAIPPRYPYVSSSAAIGLSGAIGLSAHFQGAVEPDARCKIMLWEYEVRFERNLRELVRQIEFPIVVDFEELQTLTGKIFR